MTLTPSIKTLLEMELGKLSWVTFLGVTAKSGNNLNN